MMHERRGVAGRRLVAQWSWRSREGQKSKVKPEIRGRGYTPTPPLFFQRVRMGLILQELQNRSL
jgi:hypothetical protein